MAYKIVDGKLVKITDQSDYQAPAGTPTQGQYIPSYAPQAQPTPPPAPAPAPPGNIVYGPGPVAPPAPPPFQEPSRPGAPPAPPPPLPPPPAPPAPQQEGRFARREAILGRDAPAPPVDPSSFAPAFALLAQSPGAGAVFDSLQNAANNPVQTPGSRATRADFLEERSIAPGPHVYATVLSELAAGAAYLTGFLPGGYVGAKASIQAGLPVGQVIENTFAGAGQGSTGFAREARARVLEELSPQEIDINIPSGERPWWWDIPGGPGLWDEIRMASEAGFLYPVIPQSLKIGLGWTDTAMLQAGYGFDEATNKWVLAESEDLGDAQANLGNAGYGDYGYGQYPSYNVNYPAYPSPSRSAQGLGLTNWRI